MPGAVAQRNNPANDPNTKPIKHHSNFSPNQSVFGTYAFGLVSPFHVLSTVADDHFQLRVNSDVDTYTLKAPLMAPIRMNKTYVHVPKRAVLPKNAELLITNPLTGDDVDAEKVNAVSTFTNLFGNIGYSLSEGSYVNPPTSWSYNTTILGRLNFYLQLAGASSAISGIDDQTPENRALAAIAALCQMTNFLNPFFSAGSLAANMGIDFSQILRVMTRGYFSGWKSAPATWTYDELYDIVAAYIKANVKSFIVTFRELAPPTGSSATATWSSSTVQTQVIVNEEGPSLPGVNLTFRQFIQLLNEGMFVDTISYVTLVDNALGDALGYEYDGNLLPYYVASFVSTNDNNTSAINTLTGTGKPVNYSRLVAYQLAHTQFFTDDAVDYIYSCKLWHENQMALAMALSAPVFYKLNGTRQMYDSVSSAVFDAVMSMFANCASYASLSISDPTSTSASCGSNQVGYIVALAYMSNIFSFQRSLRYRDYFVGSRKHPLGVGDTSVQVNDSTVDVVDITKSIQMQRFLNQVNRIGRTLKAYSRGIFGVTPQADPTECVFLGNTCDIIGAEETNNTADAQQTLPNSTTSKLRGESSKYAFEINVSDQGYSICMLWFEIVRPIIGAQPRDIFHVDRFDEFNPYLENIGDQPLYREELTWLRASGTFAYKMRYAEYKQSFDRAVGGFAVGALPGYAVPVTINQLSNPLHTTFELSPWFIRPSIDEIDELYVSLTHYSLATYFHFIIRNDVVVNANRPMEAAPQIL